MAVVTKNVEVAGKRISLETGRVAEQANGAVIIRQGDTVVLSTAVMSKDPREGIDFFPLTCDYEEKLYAAGKIPGAFMRREGRPSEAAILASRLTDRPLRPLFPDGFRLDIQVVSTVLSVDQEKQRILVAPDAFGSRCQGAMRSMAAAGVACSIALTCSPNGLWRPLAALVCRPILG